MATDTFRRHTRVRADAAIHHAFVLFRHRPQQHSFLCRLLRAVQAQSDLMANPPQRSGEVAQARVLRNLVQFESSLVRDPEDWRGASGHPLAVVDSLASHLFGRYPTPRFLASVWFGDAAGERVDRRSWFIAHARGQRFRSLPLPLALTRQMEHEFLRTPDHVPFDRALRRAEILGLGGTPEVADVVLTTRLAERFTDGDRWRRALAWLVRCGDSVDLSQIRPLVDYLYANLHEIELRGRTFASVMRLVRAWHGWLGQQTSSFVEWRRSRWNEMVVPVAPTPEHPRGAEWTIVELIDSHALAREGRAMRHCVSTYAHACAVKRSSIWSLRHRWHDERNPRSVLTIEVQPTTATIVQLRGTANSRARGEPLRLVSSWAAREGLRFARWL